MPYPPDHKRHTRQKILRSARRLFSARGFEAASIDEIMLECDLTRGAFYAHFRSKGHLYQEAMGNIAPRNGSSTPATGETCDRWLDALLEFCLQPADASVLRETGWTFLATDAASKQPEVRAAYTRAFKTMSQRLTQEMVQSPDSAKSSLAAMAMVVGTLCVAMTVDDMSLRASLVDACREHAKALFDDPHKDDRLSFFWTADAPDNRHGSAPTGMVH